MKAYSEEEKYYEQNYDALVENFRYKYLLIQNYSLRGVFNNSSEAKKKNFNGKGKIFFCDPKFPPKKNTQFSKMFNWVFYILEFFYFSYILFEGILYSF